MRSWLGALCSCNSYMAPLKRRSTREAGMEMATMASTSRGARTKSVTASPSSPRKMGAVESSESTSVMERCEASRITRP